MRLPHYTTAALIALLAGCANGSPEDGSTGGTDEWSTFGDAGASECYPGEHVCSGECVEDYPNEPRYGCRDGCGEPCPAPEGSTAACTSDGRCTLECEAPMERVGDRCECVPRTCEDLGASCGAVEDGCGGTLECGTCGEGTDCVDGTCSCPADEAEDNEAQAAAFDLGEAADHPRTELVLDSYGLHSATDVDWYRVRVRDAGDFSNPNITVTIADAAPGFVIGGWYVCDGGVNSSVCEEGDHSTVAGPGCSSPTDGTGATTVRLQGECGGWDESGYLLVRVMATESYEAAACGTYTLGIVVD